MQTQPSPSPFVFPSGFEAQRCANRLNNNGHFMARAAIEVVDGHSCHVVRLQDGSLYLGITA